MNEPLQHPKLATVLYDALQEDPFYTTLEASVDDQHSAKEAMLKYLDFSMQEASQYGQLYINSKHDHGVSVWSKPLSEVLAIQQKNAKHQFLLRHLGESSLSTYKNIVEFMADAAHSIIEPSAWYLSIIGVSPDHQGQGIGPELVNPVLELADKHQVSTYLETFTPKNKSFYRRLGFVEKKVVYEPTTQAEYAIMVREAKTR